MDLLRGIALLLAVAAISFSGELAYAQQEVDPDHFDHPATQSQKAAPVHHVKHAHSTVAKKGSAKHHRSHASA